MAEDHKALKGTYILLITCEKVHIFQALPWEFIHSYGHACINSSNIYGNLIR